jgi:hypothetical protein
MNAKTQDDKKGAPEMDKHEHGSMNTFNHQKTFEGFIKFMAYGATIAICILIFMAIVDG